MWECLLVFLLALGMRFLFGVQVDGTFDACDEPPEAGNAASRTTSKSSSIEAFSDKLGVYSL